MRQKLFTCLPFIIVFLIVVPAIWPIVTPGYFPMHDDTQLVRVAQMAQAVTAGQFPVRWVKDLGYGYGYPIFNFYNPLPYYVGAIPLFMGFNALVGTKLMFIVPIILAAVGIYVLTRKRLSAPAALVAATLYTYAPYHAVQIFVRGSVAEYWAYAVIPWLLHFLLKKSLLGSAISLAVLILSHNLTTIMALPFIGLLLFSQWLATSKKSLFTAYCLLLTTIGLGLSAFFWLPATVEKNLTNVDLMVEQQFNPLEHFVYPRQLWYTPWGFGGSAPGEHDGLNFMIGYVHIFLSLLAAIFLAIKLPVLVKHPSFAKKIVTLSIIAYVITIVSLFMLLPTSTMVWKVGLPLFKYLQFPWRYLSVIAFGTSLLGAIGVAIVQKFQKIPSKKHAFPLGVAVTICIIILTSLNYFQAQFKYVETANQFLSAEKVTWEYSARSDEYLPKGFIRPQSAAEALGAKNPYNQQLVNQLLQNTPVRTTANLITLMTLISIAVYLVVRKLKKTSHSSLQPRLGTMNA